MKKTDKLWRKIFPLKRGDKVRIKFPDPDNKVFKDEEGIISTVYPEIPSSKNSIGFVVITLIPSSRIETVTKRVFRQEELVRIEREET